MIILSIIFISWSSQSCRYTVIAWVSYILHPLPHLTIILTGLEHGVITTNDFHWHIVIPSLLVLGYAWRISILACNYQSRLCSSTDCTYWEIWQFMLIIIIMENVVEVRGSEDRISGSRESGGEAVGNLCLIVSQTSPDWSISTITHSYWTIEHVKQIGLANFCSEC